jgi:hypothetical protein
MLPSAGGLAQRLPSDWVVPDQRTVCYPQTTKLMSEHLPFPREKINAASPNLGALTDPCQSSAQRMPQTMTAGLGEHPLQGREWDSCVIATDLSPFAPEWRPSKATASLLPQSTANRELKLDAAGVMSGLGNAYSLPLPLFGSGPHIGKPNTFCQFAATDRAPRPFLPLVPNAAVLSDHEHSISSTESSDFCDKDLGDLLEAVNDACGTTPRPIKVKDVPSGPHQTAMKEAGCRFIHCTLVDADPALKAASFQPIHVSSLENVSELFVGQLPFDFSGAKLAELLSAILRKPSVVYRVKNGPKPTCAFVVVRSEESAELLQLSKRILCDTEGVWVAPVGNDAAIKALQQVCADRSKRRTPGTPMNAVVIEPVAASSRTLGRLVGGASNDASHLSRQAPPAYDQHTTGPMVFAPPMMVPFPWSCPSFLYPGSASGLVPAFPPGVGSFPATLPPAAAAGTGSTVCGCGFPHVKALARPNEVCLMCSQALPVMAFVFRCQQPHCADPETICLRCAKQARQPVS